MPLLGQGALVIWHDIAPEAEAEYWRWHTREHIPERVGVPGFLRGRRYRQVDRPLGYIDFYETASEDTLRSAPYLARLDDPTPWTRRLVPHFQRTLRLGFRVARSAGRGQGGVLLTARLRGEAGDPAALAAWLEGPATPALTEPAGVVAVHVLAARPEVTSIVTEEKRLRGQGAGDLVGSEVPWALLVEASDVEDAQALLAGPLAPERLRDHGARAETGVYRLQVTIDPER
jgi:hypothetical protein